MKNNELRQVGVIRFHGAGWTYLIVFDFLMKVVNPKVLRSFTWNDRRISLSLDSQKER
jgi:hypothetical protein